MTTWLRAIFTAILVALPIAAAAAGARPKTGALLAAHDAFLAGDKAKLARHAEKIRGPYARLLRCLLAPAAAPGGS